MTELQQSERDVRIGKVAKMKAMGIIPYAQSFDKKQMIGDITKTYESQELRDINDIIINPVAQVKTAGRVMLYRGHGKLAFAKLLDSTEQIQLMFHRENCSFVKGGEKVQLLQDGSEEGMSAYKFMEKMVDV
ncbi:TPA: hypothetical protein DIC40_04275 [Patescibacteria group bacterium]|nr:hypothetical protein [Candidatus Gracilibacteria bacterium]